MCTLIYISPCLNMHICQHTPETAISANAATHCNTLQHTATHCNTAMSANAWHGPTLGRNVFVCIHTVYTCWCSYVHVSVGSLKLQVSFAEYRLFCRALLVCIWRHLHIHTWTHSNTCEGALAAQPGNCHGEPYFKWDSILGGTMNANSLHLLVFVCTSWCVP